MSEVRLVGVYVHVTPVIAIPSQGALQRLQRRSTPRAHPRAHPATPPSSLPIFLAPILAPFRVRRAEQRGLERSVFREFLNIQKKRWAFFVSV